ncbi:hypothetical protein ACFWBN_14620 [Streptomyces sp. NPDC059989]|uniref:hypothetical protein n=1 Tax=Streptomyces sp. NPDC059989 TaxID=3347026 RepID=UPI00368D7380
MPLVSSRRGRIAVASVSFTTAIALLVFLGIHLSQGYDAQNLPQSSWGGWRIEHIQGWVARIRVNRWVNAAEADVRLGKSQQVFLNAYGATATETTVPEDVTFTLTPDGRLTVNLT